MQRLCEQWQLRPPPKWSGEDEAWLLERFPFLSAECLQAAVEIDVDACVSGKVEQRLSASQHSMLVEKQRAFMLAAARQQLEKLAALATGKYKGSQKARHVLWVILLSPQRLPIEMFQITQSDAASALSTVEPWPKTEFEDAFNCARSILTRRLNTAPDVRKNILRTFMNIVARDCPTEHSPPGERIGTILTETLLLELSRVQAQQDLPFGSELVKLLVMYPYPAAKEVLQIVAERHWHEALRRLALSAMSGLQADSVLLPTSGAAQ